MANVLIKILLSGWAVLGCFSCLAQEGGARISVSTTPDNATVSCDGVSRGASPLSVSGLLPGPHLIAVEMPGFIPAQRTVMVSVQGKSLVDIKLEPVTGLVLLRSTPTGADIEINGAHRGKTPLLLPDLPLGKYRLKATSLGYFSREVEFNVQSRSPQLVLVSLSSDSAVLVLRSEPPGAAVNVNGLPKGVTPCTLDRLPAGDNELSVSLPGYVAYSSRIKLLANAEERLDITLKPEPGVLSIMSFPTGAKVYLDEKLVGQAPLTLDSVAAGSHALRAEMDGYATLTRSVEFQQGEKKVEELRLERNVGTLEVFAKPEGAKVFVDEVEQGAVTLSADNPIPLFTQELAVGSHVVSLRMKGHGPVTRRVTVEKGQTVTLKEILKRVFIMDTKVTLRNGSVLMGTFGEKLADGAIRLEIQIGIYKTIDSMDIEKIESIKN